MITNMFHQVVHPVVPRAFPARPTPVSTAIRTSRYSVGVPVVANPNWPGSFRTAQSHAHLHSKRAARRGWCTQATGRDTSQVAIHTPPSHTPGLEEVIVTPKSIHDVDNGRLLGFGADLAADHPGFHDNEYKQRRVQIANLAFNHEIGQPIPRVEYTEEEAATWGAVMRELEGLFPAHACDTFLRAYPLFGFTPDKVPQLCDVSKVLQKATGWQIRPVAGLMHPRDFLAGLAFKTFHSTQYIRHACQPSYTPEPDLCHELLGHVAMLADPAFAQMVQAIGVASLGASNKEIWHLTKVYWYTVEFGVVQEGGFTKAFGAGILSSYGEMKHMAAGGAELLPLDPRALQPKMSYKDGFQKAYYVLDGFEEGTKKLQEWAHSRVRENTQLELSVE